MSVINNNRSLSLKAGDDSIIAGILAIGYGTIIMTLGIKPPEIVQILQQLFHTEYVNFGVIIIGALYIMLGFGVYFENANMAKILLVIHLLLMSAFIGYPSYQYFTDKITLAQLTTFYGPEMHTYIFIGSLILGAIIFGYGIFAATNIDAPSQTEYHQPIGSRFDRSSSFHASTSQIYRQADGYVRPDYSSPVTYSEDQQEHQAYISRSDEADMRNAVWSARKLEGEPEWDRTPRGNRSTDTELDAYQFYDYLDEEIGYYQVEKPKDLVIVYGFKYIIYEYNEYTHVRIARSCSLFKKVNRVYYNGIEVPCSNYGGDLKSGLLYELPVGKLHIIYERHCLIPFISVSVDGQILPDSPSNPFDRVLHSSKMVLLFTLKLFVCILIMGFINYQTTNNSKFPWEFLAGVGVCLLYLLCGYAIKSMNKIVAMFTGVLHIATYTSIVSIIYKNLFNMKLINFGADYFGSDLCLLLMFVAPITYFFGYYFLFIVNAYIAINDYERL